jgi:phosphatidylglycerol:prolipoprotein diacylglycerol transferase
VSEFAPLSSIFETLAAIGFPNEPFRPFGADSLELHPFGFLVGLGIVLGTIIAGKRAKVLGLSERVVADVALWAVIPGFIGAHLIHQIFYEPHEILENPLILLQIWNGISSFGGFIGGTLGVVYYFRKHKELPFLPYADSIIFGFAFAWIFGRLGCTTAFDHPGTATDFFMGMEYLGNTVINGVPLKGQIIHNLGWYEALWSMAMSLFFWTQRNKTHFKGWYLATFVVAYMPIRFALDFFRVNDATYAGMTPAQWFAIVLFGLGAYLLYKGSQKKDLLVPNVAPVLEWWPAGEAAAYLREIGQEKGGAKLEAKPGPKNQGKKRG